MNVDAQRLWQRIQTLHEIGTTPDGGVSRFSFTAEERAIKDRVTGFMKDAGLEIREDETGTLIGRREGSEAGLPVVLVGSHLDSVPNGGDFDGPLGVLAAIEALAAMKEANVETRHPIEVVAFTDEEGARFRYGMIGSRGIAGTLTSEELYEHADANGITVAEAMEQQGLSPAAVRNAARSPEDVKGYLELHIEQGKVLERAEQPVGIVTGIAGPLWLKFTLEGEAGHAGTTPMPGRQDPLAAAAEVLLVIEREAGQKERTVGTVGQMTVTPGGVNIIPGRVEFTLDLRDVVEQTRDEVEERILQQAQEICRRRGVSLKIDTLQRVAPVTCDEKLQGLMREAADELGLNPPMVVSGAGHDGMQFTGCWPVAMLFARSKDGISHNPAEYTSQEDCAMAADVLLGTLLRFANEA
ncbi:Zn-dependent hydrolase [Alicyclobacillus ferrooxydans]|uniref:Allantoate amidohydrolase n=1 Tax=Alicyclobacillus ferrooxydans TaxID=471514 RepID=A0A0N8PNV9_9BACL|nr:Zn-dependent hydrolase [Alicyclobacillus ferrooxydans]KPV42613.1 allantoate amidohydrolase [Alicyclobacillus ferrooxydans]